ncbi:hypothetical protein HH310_36325 [Actinoplanes sp. TBRC 11911]|uniref:hypothetical protein n=1 Tax=Actinoplanes sp. TBRC 11911 TaxID=2729386 RepID=UPI00145E291A|nr:hypothetical protein [Actinoplanes sp. TBRC 11911]NMO56627.1 hypothetical protein [Actinoplanes sp. TBRC 11911]
MRQSSTGRPSTAEADTTLRLDAADPEKTATLPLADKDVTASLEVGERTAVIPATPVDEPVTRALPAPPDVGRTTEVPAPLSDHRPEFALVGVLAAGAGIAGLVARQDTVQLVLELVFAVFGPGAALMSVANVRSRLLSWALAVLGSLTAVTGAAVLSLWTHTWQPFAVIAVLAAGTLIGSGLQFARLSRAGVPVILGRTGPPHRNVDNGRLLATIPFVTLAAGLGLWIVSLARLQPGQVGVYGFTSSLGVPFVVGVILLLIGFAVEVVGRARPWVLTGVLVAVPVIMQATVPLLDGTVEYAWTYKHIGVVDLLRDNGHLLASNDIYQQWPGFFAVVAMLSHVSGLDALSFAAWSQLFFTLVNSLLTAALLRQFTRDRRVLALGVLLMQITMWVDIAYFSPQAFVYPLMLGFWVIVLRWLLVTPPAFTGRFWRFRGWVLRGMPDMPDVAPRARMWAGLGATAVFAAITVSHQLSPFMMLVPVVVFALLGVLRPRWLAGALILVVVAFVAPRLASVDSQYSIFSLDVLANAEGNANSWGTPEQAFSAEVSRVLAIGVWLAALGAVFLARKRLGRVALPALLAFLPLTTLIAGNYGGEAIYRVFAFSIPFVALLVGTIWVGLIRRVRDRWGVPAMLASGALLAAIMLAGLQGLQGQVYVHQMSATDIDAAEYFYAHARPDSGLVLVAPNFPTKLTANYGSFNRGHVDVDIALVGDPEFTGSLSAARLPDIESYIRNLHYDTNYLVVSQAMARYTDYFGTEPPGTMAALDSAMRASPDWHVFYQAPGVTIFQLTGDAPAAN